MPPFPWPRVPRLRELAARRRDPVVVLPYLGYGSSGKLRVSGRVLEDEGFVASTDAARRWDNLVAFVKRMESDEVAGARVVATRDGRSVETVSDGEGYFSAELETVPLEGGWHDVALELPDHGASAIGKVLVPPADAEFGVISDLDDTVIRSGVTRKVRMLVQLATSNARTRKPFEGVAAFYRALHRGRNPFFYVSNGPRNLYAPLVEFLEHQKLPAGPLLLRDFGLRMASDHKRRTIEDILAAYPTLGFLLVGDSGEQDPETYTDILGRFPDRIRTIYIRSVDRSTRRLAALDRLVAKVAATKCQLVVAPDSEFAAAHAAGEGLIAAADLAAIRADKQADRGAGSS